MSNVVSIKKLTVEDALNKFLEIKSEIKELENELEVHRREIEQHLASMPNFRDDNLHCQLIENTREFVNVKELKNTLGNQADKFIRKTFYTTLKVS